MIAVIKFSLFYNAVRRWSQDATTAEIGAEHQQRRKSKYQNAYTGLTWIIILQGREYVKLSIFYTPGSHPILIAGL